jgi:uncharacterized protein (TIGR04222 family)
MITNPLDWPAGPFLTLYVVVAALAGVAVALVRSVTGGIITPDRGRDLGLLELAWLSGGPARAADTVMVSLLNAGAASIEARSLFVAHASDGRPLPNEIRGFRRAVSFTGKRAQFHRSIRTQLEPLHEGLVQRGLVPGPSDLMTIRLMSLSLILLPTLLGLAKILVGLSRGRPVGILCAMVFSTVEVGVLTVIDQPRLTRGGRAAIKRAKSGMARAARAPLGSEIPLAFAVSGAAVLAGTQYEAFRKLMPAGGNGCGGGGDGGGGGGSGCGGCSAN